MISLPNSSRNQYEFFGEKSFHVTLIRPPEISAKGSLNVSSVTPPLAMAYLSSILKENNISVRVIDSIGEGLQIFTPLQRNPKMEARGLTFKQIVERIPEYTKLIGVSSMFSLEWPATRDLIFLIKEKFPRVPIIVGGEHVTALPEFSMNECPAIDYVALGEGEFLLLELCKALSEKQNLHNFQLPGLLYRDEEKIKYTLGTPREKNFSGASGRRITELEKLSWPSWELTPIRNYLDNLLTFGKCNGATMPIIGSRGCPYECTFCSNPGMWGRKYVTRDVRDLVDEIEYYKGTYGITAVEFYDLTPIIRKSWILDFCKELMKRDLKISWQISGGTRCEAIDEEVIKVAKESGCMYLGFAPESGVQKVLDRIKKKIKLSHLLEILKIAKRYHLDTRCNFIIGFPEDNRFDIYQTILFQWKLAIRGVVDAPIFDFTPYPGSEIFSRLRKEGVIPELNDEYFESLGLNLQIRNRIRYCKNVSPAELFLYRVIGMGVFYGIYYLFRPRKIFRFGRNLFSYKTSNSVFEQRIIQNFQKFRAKVLPSSFS
jgi:anaerobic magnesium-protoporphyrin IX monomethyl ester cyclase